MDVTLSRGQTVAFSGYSLRYLGERVERQPQRVVLIANLAVTRDGRNEGRVTPSLNLYPAASEPIGTPSIEYGVFKDLYSSVVSFEGDGQTATFRLFLNPGVMWLWIGGGIMVLGGLLSVWPSRRGRPAPLPPLPERELAEVG
jgi:cytochrome c-type biogenesis protein CcmF